MVRVALVGAGSHSATQHAPALRMLAERRPEQVELAAVCDPMPAKAARVAEQYGFARHVQSLDELSGAALDGLVVVLPIPAMAQATPQFLRRRLPMVIEKPLGRNLSEAREIVAAVEASGVPVMVSLNRRFDPALRMALEWVRRERLCIRLVEGCMLRSHRAEPDFLWGTGLHLIDALCHVAGPWSCREYRNSLLTAKAHAVERHFSEARAASPFSSPSCPAPGRSKRPSGSSETSSSRN